MYFQKCIARAFSIATLSGQRCNDDCRSNHGRRPMIRAVARQGGCGVHARSVWRATQTGPVLALAHHASTRPVERNFFFRNHAHCIKVPSAFSVSVKCWGYYFFFQPCSPAWLCSEVARFLKQCIGSLYSNRSTSNCIRGTPQPPAIAWRVF